MRENAASSHELIKANWSSPLYNQLKILSRCYNRQHKLNRAKNGAVYKA